VAAPPRSEPLPGARLSTHSGLGRKHENSVAAYWLACPPLVMARSRSVASRQMPFEDRQRDRLWRDTLKSRLITSRRPGAWKVAILTSGEAEGSGLRQG
jgi:hypothetical protein